MKTIIIFVTIILSLVAVPLSGSQDEAYNSIAVIVDGSGSYRARQIEALTRSRELLEAIAGQKVRRWEMAEDRIAVIALDAMPDVLWQGSARELKATDPAAWQKRFDRRRDFSGCTDVNAAFRLALRHTAGDSGPVSRYIVAFTDLIHEPPTTTLRACAPVNRRAVPADFPWEELEGVSVSILWVPPDQTLIWRRAAEARGLDQSFVVYTDSESGEIELAPPQKVDRVMTAAEREAGREQVLASGRTVLSWIGKAMGIGVVSLLGLGLIAGVAAAISRRRSAKATVRRRVRG